MKFFLFSDFISIFAAFIIGGTLSGMALGASAESWRGRVIYFAVLDRFFNGNSNNDEMHGDANCNVAGDAHAYQGGDLAGLNSKVDYIRDLGADALWVTPLYKGVAARQGANCGFTGYWADFSWPYKLELDPRFGTAQEFDRLIKRAHEHGMPVMLDMVVNHAGYGASLTRQRPDWFTDMATCHLQGSPDIYCSLAGLPDFDHRRRDVRDYLVDAHQQWLKRFAFDGIRMDTVKHVEPWYFRHHWLPAMRAERPGIYAVGELLDEHSFDRFDAYLEAGFDGLFNFPLRRSLVETFAKGHSVDIAASRMMETLGRFGESRAGLMVNLLDNHDVPRFLAEIPHGIHGEIAQRRYLLAMTALLTLPGIPQIYYGNELGMYGGQDPHNRRFMPEWAFSDAGRSVWRPGFLPQPNEVFGHTKRLLSIRHDHAALRTGNYTELWRQNGAQNSNVWAFLRVEGTDQVIVAFNNGERWTDKPLPLYVGDRFADGQRFIDRLGQVNGVEFVVRRGHLALSLPGRAAAILVPVP